MIQRGEMLTWPMVEKTTYKNEVGTWQDVSRRVLFSSEESQFETRYFEIGPGGYTSEEKHQHEHCVIVMRGNGMVLLDGIWQTLGYGDVVHVAPMVAHQFLNQSEQPFGILCVVDKDRDRPILLGNPGLMGNRAGDETSS